jgi:hypothetical protein
VLLATGWLAVGTTLQVLRQSGIPALDSVWAEDGTIWMSDVLIHGHIGAFFDTYAGYYHLLPRVLAAPISLFPLEWTAATLALTAALVVAALSLFVFVQSRALFDSVVARAGLAVLVAIPSPGAWETTANITNLQWNLLYPCCWALLVAPPSTARTVVAAVVAMVAALTAPVSIVFVPLAIWVLIRWERPASLTVGGGFLLATAVQVAVSLFQGTPQPVETHLSDVLPLYAVRVGAGSVLGDPALVDLWPSMGWGLALLGGAVAAVLALAVLPDRRRRLPFLAMAAASVAAFGMPVFLRGTILITPGEQMVLNGSKWVLGPLLLLATLLVAVGEGPPGSPRWIRWPVRAVVVAALAFAVGSSYRVATDRSEGPRWSSSIESARVRCRTEGVPIVEVPVSPKGFSASIPCDRLVGPVGSALPGSP